MFKKVAQNKALENAPQMNSQFGDSTEGHLTIETCKNHRLELVEFIALLKTKSLYVHKSCSEQFLWTRN